MRVIVADDSVLLREGVTRLLENAGHEVVGQAADRDELMRKARAHKPDVAIIDIRMPPTHTNEGLQAARAIREEMPGTGVVVLSAYIEEAYALELLAEDPAGGSRLPTQGPGLGRRPLRRGGPEGSRGRLGPRSRGRLPHARAPAGPGAARDAHAARAGHAGANGRGT